MPIDFDGIRRDYSLPDVARQSGLVLEKDGREFRACCPFHAEKTASFTIYPDKGKTWRFHCFGCGIHGDVVDYVRERYGLTDNGDAARVLTGEIKKTPITRAAYLEKANPYEGYTVTRPPADAPPIKAREKTPPLLNPKRIDPQTGKPKFVTYKPTMVFPYRNRSGELLGYVLRVDFDDKKITPGIWWQTGPDGFEGWAHGAFPDPRPLYGADLLAQRPDAQVLLVEGEKCADAANRLMAGKNVVAVSWMGGGKSVSKTFWKSLAGRSVVIWPDNDREGWRTALGYPHINAGWTKGLVELLLDAGARNVKIVHIEPSARRDGWDIADAEAEGLDQAAVSLIIKSQVQEWTRERIDTYRREATEHDRSEHLQVSDTLQGPAAPGDELDPHPHGAMEEAQQPSELAASRDTGRSGNGHDPNPPETYRGTAVDETNWRQHLIPTEKGGLKSTSLRNFGLVLEYEKRFAGVFAWNEFANQVYLVRRPPWDMRGHNLNQWEPRPLTDNDVTAAAAHMEYCGLSPKRGDMGAIVNQVAEQNSYNPVIDALDAMRWDQVPRLGGGTYHGDTVSGWLSEYMGADDAQAATLFGRKWMIGAVARAMEPGCKMDTMLVLEGPQGIKKSTALRTLADAVHPRIFTDQTGDVGSKDAQLLLQGVWIVEVAELNQLRKADVDAIKAWLTAQTDRFRRPYGKVVETFNRSIVFAGTVNPLGNSGYLKDPTGGRRFWPVLCGDIDLERLRRDAYQLWAEAVHAFKQGEHWWMEGEEVAIAAAEQAKRYETDPWSELLDDATRHLTSVRMNDLLKAVDVPTERRNIQVTKRITAHMETRGWKQSKREGRIVFDAPKKETLV